MDVPSAIATASAVRLWNPRLEALLGLLLVPIAILLGMLSSARRLVLDGRRELSAAPYYEIGDQSTEPLLDVASFAQRAEIQPIAWRMGFGMMDFEMCYAADFVPSTLDHRPALANKYFHCPKPFRKVTFDSFDGTPLAAEMATRDDRERPGLVVVHGTFGASGHGIYARPAIEAFERWGFNVIVVNLRGWGPTAALSDVPICGGWRESEDVLSAARYLLDNSRTKTVGAMGFSLGGATVLLAAADERAPALLASGVFSESGFTDAREVVKIIEHRPGLLSRDFIGYQVFNIGFNEKFKALKLGRMSIVEYFERVSAPYYGVAVDDLFARNSVLPRAGDIRVPAFHLHGVDDWIVPVWHAEQLRAATAGNSLAGVCIRERGSHCAFARVASQWRERVAREFFASTSGVELDA